MFADVGQGFVLAVGGYILYKLKGVKLAKKLEAEGKAIVIAPEDTCGVSTLSRDKEKQKYVQKDIDVDQ